MRTQGRTSSLRRAGLGAILAGIMCAWSAQAGTATFNFNSDPSLDGASTNYGASVWVPDGGVTGAVGDGWLQLTAAGGGQSSSILFEDFDAGSVVKAFTFEVDLRIGNGTQSPADGFSINYCRNNDPALLNALSNPGGPGSAPVSGWAAGPNCEANLPEEGTQTGIAIGFDAWNSGGSAPYCDGMNVPGAGNLGPDIIGMSIRVDGQLVAQFPMATLNGACNDATSLQTGPWTGDNSTTGLCWARLKVELNDLSQLSVWWKGVQLLTNYQTTYFPSPGRLLFGGRTGGSNQNQNMDNIVITTVPAALALVGNPTGFPDGFGITLSDSGSSVVNPATVTAQLNGSPATPLTVTKNGGTTTATYHGFPTLLPVGSTNTVVVAAKDTNNNDINGTKTFVVSPYGTVAAADAVTGVNTGLPGMTVLPWQSPGEPNQIYWMLEQLAGLRGPNDAAFTTPQTFNSVINFNKEGISAGGTGDAGSFQSPNYPDAVFPGIPGANGLTGSSALNVQCYLEFQTAGVYTMGVNSDDGFLVSVGKNPNDWFANWLGRFNGGKGASDVLFTFAVTNAGIYPVRMAWENGNGEAGNGANCEWFTVQNGVKILLNDPSGTNTSGVRAYYVGPSLPAFVSAVQPNPGSGNNVADSVFAQLTDAGTTVPGGSVQLYVNGALKAPVITKVGANTSVKLSLSVANLLPPGANNAALVWSDSAGTPHSNYWTFTVAAYATLNAAQSTPLGSEDLSQPGFRLSVAQFDFDFSNPGDGIDNQVDEANGIIAGLFYPWYSTNTADLADSFHGGVLPADVGNTWYWSNVVDFAINGSAGDFPNNFPLPGIPGVSFKDNNLAALFQTYLVFPSAGYFRMGVSSDDGFRVSQGFAPIRQVLHVNGTGVNTDVGAVVGQKAGAAGGLGVDLPVVPIVAEVVPVTTSTWGGPPNPLPNVAGKIVVADRALYGANDQLMTYVAQTNGALAIILINQPANGFPFKIGGTAPAPITIPVLCVSGFAGQRDFWLTNGTLTATIGASQEIMLGSADYGKGMSWVDFGFVIPQAGVYPINMIFEQGGGGAGVEWCIYQADGTRVLVNDINTPSSVLAYRAVTVQPPPTLSVAKVGNAYQLTYTGVLRSSSTVNGTYNPVPGATSPYTIPTSGGPQQFYRASNN